MPFKLASPEDIPATAPEEVRYAINISAHAEDHIDRTTSWGALDGVLLRFWHHPGDTVFQVGLQDMQLGPDTIRAVDAINLLIATMGPASVPYEHVAVVAITETLRGIPGRTEPGQPKQVYDDLVAAGARQGRAAVGTTRSGWWFTVSRDRIEAQQRIQLWEPGEDPPTFEIVGAVAALQRHYITLEDQHP